VSVLKREIIYYSPNDICDSLVCYFCTSEMEKQISHRRNCSKIQ